MRCIIANIHVHLLHQWLCDACIAATAGELLRQGLHTAEILEGYKRAFEKCMEELPSLVCHTVQDVRDKAQLVYAIKTTLASKQYGFEVSAPALISTGHCSATKLLLPLIVLHFGSI